MMKDDHAKQVLKNRPDLSKFPQHCGKTRHYVFRLKKCEEQTCFVCAPPRLPPEAFSTLHHLPYPLRSADGEHKLSFTKVCGKDTSEKNRSSLTDSCHCRKLHGMPFNPNAQYAWYVNEYVICCDCDKPRILYAARKLQLKEIEQLKLELEMVLYTHGSSLQDLGSSNPVVSKPSSGKNWSCSDSVKVPCYSSDSFQDVCIHCGTTHNLAERETDIYPTCSTYLRTKTRLQKCKHAQVGGPRSKKHTAQSVWIWSYLCIHKLCELCFVEWSDWRCDYQPICI